MLKTRPVVWCIRGNSCPPFPPPPHSLSPLPSVVHKEGTVPALFRTKQSLHCNLGGVQLRKLLPLPRRAFTEGMVFIS